MTLESLKLWAEKDLLMDDGKTEYGFVGYFKGLFADNGLVFAPMLFQPDSMELQSAFSMLTRFLQSEDAYGILQDRTRMELYCRDRLHDHIPYSFNRECWGFRVLADRYAWYLACTPWNEKRQFTIYCYERTALMTALASMRGLPESCYGVLPFTGERIRIRFGEDRYEDFPQYGADQVANRHYAEEQNAPFGITPQQMAAMENGAIYGWDTPMADPNHYDEGGHYHPYLDTKGGRSR